MSRFRRYTTSKGRGGKTPVAGTGRSYSLTEKTVIDHMGLVVDVARAYFQKFRRYGYTNTDVIQLATLGVLKRVKYYDKKFAVGTFIPLAVESEFHNVLTSLAAKSKEKELDPLSGKEDSRAYFIQPSNAIPTVEQRDLVHLFQSRARAVLPPFLQRYFDLHIIEGLPNEEVARRLGIAKKTSEGHYQRMVRLLRADPSIQSLIHPSVTKNKKLKLDSMD